MTQESWGPEWTALIGAQVLAQRKRRGLSAQQLADRTEAIGFPIARNVIANLENRRKRDVSVQEVAAIAWALDVPPVALLVDLSADQVEVAPGEAGSPLAAVLWWSGEVAGRDVDDAAREPVRILADLRALNRSYNRWIDKPYKERAAHLRLQLVLRERVRSAGASVPKAMDGAEQELRRLEAASPAEREAYLADLEDDDV